VARSLVRGMRIAIRHIHGILMGIFVSYYRYERYLWALYYINGHEKHDTNLKDICGYPKTWWCEGRL
jgi:hypothetical protein